MRKIHLSGAALLALSVASSAPVFAADLPSIKEAPAPIEPPVPSGWRFEATINGWAPSLISNIGVRNLPTASADVGFFKLLEHVNYVVPLTVVARNDNFIGGVDLFAVGVSAGASFRGQPTGVGQFGGVGAHLHLSETILTGFAGARLPIQVSNLSVFGIIGARYINVSTDLTLNTVVAGFSLSSSQSRDWADPIIGVTAKYDFNDKWFLKAEADIGGYDRSVTWQTFGALGYNWSQAISLTAGFRALYVDFEHRNNTGGSNRFQETLLGPQLTITYAF